AVTRLVVAHGVAGVENQVQHDLLQLHAIAPYQWKPRRQTSGHRDSAAKQVATKDLDDVVDHVVQRELPGVVPPIGKPAAKFAQHASGTPAVGDDICEDDINFGAVVSAAARAETPGSLGVPKDRRERLTELVRQRRRQHAHRHDATGMRELLAHAKRLGLLVLSPADVAVSDDGSALFPPERNDGNREPAQRVRWSARVLHLEQFSLTGEY